VVEKMLGLVNTKVRLTIIRDGYDKPVELTAVRKTISMRSVHTRQDGEDIGYIRIAAFNEVIMRTFGTAIRELSSQIPPDRIKGYVLDLRNTAYGLLDAAVSVADEFLEDSEIASARGRNPEQIEHFNARPAGRSRTTSAQS
jgi:carboxyl-terminal processing protease